MRSWLLALVAVTAVTASGCKSNPYCLNCKDSGNGVISLDMTEGPDLYGTPGDGGGGPDLASHPDGGPCVATGAEKCDGIDNDCNGIIDDVPQSSLVGDPNNCGGCGIVCKYPNAFGQCTGGFDGGTPSCHIGSCAPGHLNQDGDDSNGCEYTCTPTADPTEICDGKDNNCDGKVDEGFTLTWTDTANQHPRYDKNTLNCGACGSVCSLGAGTVMACQVGGSANLGQCVVSGCVNAIVNGKHVAYRHNKDIGPIATTGCEYLCPVAPTEIGKDCNPPGACTFGPELCDGLDDDCNFLSEIGKPDPDPKKNAYEPPTDPSIGQRCPDNMIGKFCSDSANTCVGVCTPGTVACSSGGSLQCINSTGPSGGEICDGKDNDCDGKVDNGFTSTWSDAGNQLPRYDGNKLNCGACGTSCGLLNATNGCNLKLGDTKGSCYVVSCDAGWFYATHLDSSTTTPTCDVNVTQPENSKQGVTGIGCNYKCNVSPQAPEVCDGKDNDCDGCTDNGLNGSSAPKLCATKGVCAGLVDNTTCRGASGYKCDYSSLLPLVSLDSPDKNGNLTATEPQCDNLDNNCNGPCDENFPDVLVSGAGCTNMHAAKSCTAGSGACQTSGPFTCQKSGGIDIEACSATADNTKATDEKCNGKDDDCNGLIDEPTTATIGNKTFQGWHDPTVQVAVGVDPFTGAAAHTVFVYQYEASRPDATGIATGSSSARACSNVGTLPWSNVTFQQATAACAAVKNAAGAAIGRLCTAWEWQQTCAAQSTTGTHFSMSSTPTAYSSGICNDGNETEQRCTGAGQCVKTCNGSGQCTCTGAADCSPGFICTGGICVGSGAWPTGSAGTSSGGGNQCYTTVGGGQARDLTGNLQEWTGTPVTVKSGIAATLATSTTAGTLTLGGLTSIQNTDVGAQVVISGSARPANNGTFDVVSFVSSTSVLIRSPSGSAPDSNLTWKLNYYKLRGGAFSTGQSGGLTCEFDFDIQKASFANTDLGFRCCSDSAP